MSSSRQTSRVSAFRPSSRISSISKIRSLPKMRKHDEIVEEPKEYEELDNVLNDKSLRRMSSFSRSLQSSSHDSYKDQQYDYNSQTSYAKSISSAYQHSSTIHNQVKIETETQTTTTLKTKNSSRKSSVRRKQSTRTVVTYEDKKAPSPRIDPYQIARMEMQKKIQQQKHQKMMEEKLQASFRTVDQEIDEDNQILQNGSFELTCMHKSPLIFSISFDENVHESESQNELMDRFQDTEAKIDRFYAERSKSCLFDNFDSLEPLADLDTSDTASVSSSVYDDRRLSRFTQCSSVYTVEENEEPESYAQITEDAEAQIFDCYAYANSSDDDYDTKTLDGNSSSTETESIYSCSGYPSTMCTPELSDRFVECKSENTNASSSSEHTLDSTRVDFQSPFQDFAVSVAPTKARISQMAGPFRSFEELSHSHKICCNTVASKSYVEVSRISEKDMFSFEQS